MQRIMRIGKPTHLKVTGPGPGPKVSWTACGLIGTAAHVAAWDPRDVDCINCRRTVEWRERMEGAKS